MIKKKKLNEGNDELDGNVGLKDGQQVSTSEKIMV